MRPKIALPMVRIGFVANAVGFAIRPGKLDRPSWHIPELRALVVPHLAGFGLGWSCRLPLRGSWAIYARLRAMGGRMFRLSRVRQRSSQVPDRAFRQLLDQLPSLVAVQVGVFGHFLPDGIEGWP